MSLSTSMEAYLSLVTVVIMCVPGLVFLVKLWRKNRATQMRKSETLPVYEQRIRPVTWTHDAILHPLPTPYRYFCTGDPLLAAQILASHSMPDLGCNISVSGPNHLVRKVSYAETFLIHWQDTTFISLPESAHVRSERRDFPVAMTL